jgi:hypothetical protein
MSRVPRSERRLRGKDDTLDAVRTARAALPSETLALPRSGERREALRLLLVARRSAVGVRREALGQLRGVIVTAPDGLREELRTLPVDWFNHRRLFEAHRQIPPAEFEQLHYRQKESGQQAETQTEQPA